MKITLFSAALLIGIFTQSAHAQSTVPPFNVSGQESARSQPIILPITGYDYGYEFSYQNRSYGLNEQVLTAAPTKRSYSWIGYQLTQEATRKLKADLSALPEITLAEVTVNGADVRIASTAKWKSVKPRLLHFIRLALHTSQEVYIPGTPPYSPNHYPGPNDSPLPKGSRELPNANY